MNFESSHIKTIFFAFIIAISWQNLCAQESTKWDNTNAKDWPPQCKVVTIESSKDHKDQPSYYYKSKSIAPQPLIVSLHTWSGGFEQKDPIVSQCIEKDYNYIHPHFRGPNNTFEACGSELAIQDIDDAIQFAIDKGNVDISNIHIIGVSGGGYAALFMYMRSNQPVKSFSAWVPISNLVDWYRESEGRKNKYGKDVAMATTGLKFENGSYHIDTVEAIKRSPIFMDTPIEKRKNSKLYLYTGIHDGYTGSVPISQTLKFYNKVLFSFDPGYQDLIPESDMITMLASRSFPHNNGDSIGDRLIHYRKNFKDIIQLTVFEGAHEQIESVALDHIPSQKILIIGDSNGAMKDGWVDQLKVLRFKDQIYNTSIGGNTIGFDNLGYKKLNTLRNINSYMKEADSVLHGIDEIIILLGTNDCKAVFKDSIKQSPKNLSALIRRIKTQAAFLVNQPEIIIVSPPPIADDEQLQEKYYGAQDRLNKLLPKLQKVALEEGCNYLDINKPLLEDFINLNRDGIHLNIEGQKRTAALINSFLDQVNEY